MATKTKGTAVVEEEPDVTEPAVQPTAAPPVDDQREWSRKYRQALTDLERVNYIRRPVLNELNRSPEQAMQDLGAMHEYKRLLETVAYYRRLEKSIVDANANIARETAAGLGGDHSFERDMIASWRRELDREPQLIQNVAKLVEKHPWLVG